MNVLTESVQILRDAGGHPAFAVLPFAQYQALLAGKADSAPGVPNAVVNAVFGSGVSVIAAWREHLHLTQAEVAARMSISQAALAQTEASKRPRKATLEKVAVAMGLELSQLTW